MKYVNIDRCSSINPTTNNQCTMSTNHFGPHKIGDVYSPTERWVTKCSNECDFHHNSDGRGNEWEECINCGDKK
jgi:hypothetical protein